MLDGYMFKGQIYYLDNNKDILRLMRVLMKMQIIRAKVTMIGRELVVIYYNNLWQKIGTSKDVISVLGEII